MLPATFRKLMIAGLSLAIVSIMLPNAYAQRFDRATKITINQPFEIPGTALPAGTYVIRLVDVAGTRTVVQILNADETKSYAIVLGIPDYRLDVSENTQISFYEAKPGVPVPMRGWFYPGYNSGVEFVYPKTRAFEIARTSGEHVIAAPWQPEYIPEPGEFETEPLIVIEPTGEEVDLAVVHPELEEPVVVEEQARTEPVLAVQAEVPLEAVQELPRTASPFPLVTLTGLLAAGAASAVRLVRRWKG